LSLESGNSLTLSAHPPGQLRFVDRRNDAAWEKNTASPSADIGNSCTFIGELPAGHIQHVVAIGIPMPAVYCEIIKHAVGTSSANEMTLFGQVYDLAAAQRMGVVNRIVPSERLIDEAVAWAGAVEPGCHPAYAFTKRALQAATLRAIDDARRLDLDLLASRMTDAGSLRADARRYRELKGRDPTWEIAS
jgi:hypothetical protein